MFGQRRSGDIEAHMHGVRHLVHILPARPLGADGVNSTSFGSMFMWRL
jgi:hypothetical protein